MIVLLGAPGSGKGTVAACLSGRHPDLTLVAAGDLLRDAVQRDTPAGREAGRFMRQGGLVPDDVIARLIGERLESGGRDGRYLLDGFPRTVEQAGKLDEMVATRGARLMAVIQIDVPEEIILGRLLGRLVCSGCAKVYHAKTMPPRKEGRCDVCDATLTTREDDKPETVRNRLKVYDARTASLIDLYRDRGLLRRVNGVGTADEVADRVARAMA